MKSAGINQNEFTRVKNLLYTKSGKTEMEFKQLSTFEFRQIKAKVREEQKKEDLQLILGVFATVGIISFCVLSLLYAWTDYFLNLSHFKNYPTNLCAAGIPERAAV